MDDIQTLFDSDEAENEYMKEQEARRLKAEEKKQIEEMVSDIEQSGMLDSLSRCRIVAEELYIKGYRKQSEWISVEERLPNDQEWVQVYDGNRRYKILRFEKGIDEDTREKMRTGEIPDPETTGWTKTDGFFMIKRSKQFKAADVFGNNMVPYCWRTEYGDTIFGQNITWWRNLPEPPKGDRHEM